MKNTFIADNDRLETMLVYCEIVPNLHQVHDPVARTTQRNHEIRQHLAGLRFERRVREFSALRIDL
ncbi:MAG TPA: hypothetical protein VF534_08845 [Paraburkholderia sp.]